MEDYIVSFQLILTDKTTGGTVDAETRSFIITTMMRSEIFPSASVRECQIVDGETFQMDLDKFSEKSLLFLSRVCPDVIFTFHSMISNSKDFHSREIYKAHKIIFEEGERVATYYYDWMTLKWKETF